MSSNPPLTAPSSGQSKRPLSYPKPQAEFQEIVRNPQLFWQMLQAFHVSLGDKYLLVLFFFPLLIFLCFFAVSCAGLRFSSSINNSWMLFCPFLVYPSTISSLLLCLWIWFCSIYVLCIIYLVSIYAQIVDFHYAWKTFEYYLGVRILDGPKESFFFGQLVS